MGHSDGEPQVPKMAREMEAFPADITPADRAYSLAVEGRNEGVVALLRQWGVPTTVVLAAEMAVEGTGVASSPCVQDEEAIRLAQEVAALEQQLTAPLGAYAEVSGSVRVARHLQQLFYKAYTDVPVVLLYVARHATVLREVASATSAEAHRLTWITQAVFLPVVETLGLWDMYRDLANWRFQLLHPETYAEITSSLLASSVAHQADIADVIETLTARLKELGIMAQIRVQPPMAYSVQRKCERGAAREALVHQLRFSVIAETETDNARIIEIATELWPCIGEGYRLRLGQPARESRRKFNGYREEVSRHEYVMSTAFADQTTLELRVCSATAEPINRCGIVAAYYTHPDMPMPRNAWWTNKKTASLVAANPPGSKNEAREIYAFSPVGQAYRLPANSTAVDFAFAVHTEIAEQAVGVTVNGHPANFSDKLVCGDIVQIARDPASPGPPDQWLTFAFSDKARRLIKRARRNRVSRAMQGRSQFGDLLQRALRRYGISELPPRDVDRYLETTAIMLGYEHADWLLADLGSASPKIRPRDLVYRLIRQYLVPNIISEDGTELTHPLHRIRLASGIVSGQRVFVTPGRPIVGKKLPAPNDHQQGILEIYPKEALETYTRLPGTLVPLVWRPTHAESEAFLLTIQCMDKPRVLGRVLDVLYEFYSDGLYIYELSAKVRADDYVEIECKLTCRTFETIKSLTRRLEELQDDNDIISQSFSGLLPVERAMLGGGVSISNPYTPHALEGIALKKWFLGRQRDIASIRDILASTNLLVLVGPTGVGKTTLLRFLRHHVFAEKTYLPVLVEGVNPWTENKFWSTLLTKLSEAVADRVGKPLLLDEPSAIRRTPYEAFRSTLTEEFRKRCEGVRPILLIDEFSGIDTGWPPEEARTVVSQIMELGARSDIAIVVCVHAPASTFREEPRTSRLRSVATSYPLGALDTKGARDLITAPLMGFVEFSDEAVERLCYVSGRYPFYLQILLFHLYRSLQVFRPSRLIRVERDDVERVAGGLIADSGVFEWFYRQAGRVHEGVIEVVAWASIDGEHPASLADIDRERRQNKIACDHLELRRALAAMVDLGVLTRLDREGDPSYAFAVPLFGTWLTRRYPAIRGRRR